VKICSLYGVGFYYIPGTDMCIKIGGWVRAEYGWGQNGNFAWGWANANVNNRTTNNSDFRARGYITADARNQTDYGTVRGYIAVGLSENEHGGDVNASTSFSANRAFIQWAGFTFGRAQSFFDFYSNPATSYWGAFPGSDTGDGGWFVMGYTAQFGNGLSGSIAVEAPRKTGIADGLANIVGGAFVPLATGIPGNNYGGFQAPDVVANLRLDQAWGSAQIMGALHDVNATYYSGLGANAASLASGHPDDKVGWVIGGGIKLNAPFTGVGDYFQAQVNYTQGALRYVFQTAQPSWSINDTGNSAGYGVITDAVYNGLITSAGAGAATSLELTTAWNVNAAYEHFWSPRWRTSLYGGYAQVSYNSNANSILCGFGTNGVVTNGCDSDWQTWWVGSRTQWNVTKDFYMGVDVMYSKLQSATIAVSPTLGALAVSPNLGFIPQTDPDNWSFRFRVHRDFYP
jgi:Porin subfamily